MEKIQSLLMDMMVSTKETYLKVVEKVVSLVMR